MDLLSIIIVSVALAMDSVTVSVSCGLILRKFELKNALLIGLYMSFFQGIMPIIGYLLGLGFKNIIEPIDHWVALAILAFLGIKMIINYFSKNEQGKCLDPTKKRVITALAIATSIDALAVGITIDIFMVPVYCSCIIIALITFILSTTAVFLGSHFRKTVENKPFELIGGIVLIAIGIKIVLEHLQF